MSDSPLPRSPFAGTIDFSDDTPVHPIDPDELARALQAHELYVETGQRSGQRANLDATDLAGKSFAGMKLWRIRMRRADLAGADFTGADLRRAILIGATMQGGRIAAADLTRGRLSGINLTDADGGGAEALGKEIAGCVWFRHGWLAARGLDPAQCAVIRVVGESMEPLLWEGDSILVDRARRWLLVSEHPSWGPVPWPGDAETIGQAVWTARSLV